MCGHMTDVIVLLQGLCVPGRTTVVWMQVSSSLAAVASKLVQQQLQAKCACSESPSQQAACRMFGTRLAAQLAGWLAGFSAGMIYSIVRAPLHYDEHSLMLHTNQHASYRVIHQGIGWPCFAVAAQGGGLKDIAAMAAALCLVCVCSPPSLSCTTTQTSLSSSCKQSQRFPRAARYLAVLGSAALHMT